MNFQISEAIDRDWNGELLELLVELLFLGAPVETGPPNCSQSANFFQWDTHIPTNSVYLIRQNDLIEFLT